jgi:hypothetical protein
LVKAMNGADTIEREKTLPRIAIRFDHAGDNYTVTYGRFPDGRPSEIFLTGPCPFYIATRMASMALQHGAPIEAVRGVLIGGPMATAIDRVIAACMQEGADE